MTIHRNASVRASGVSLAHGLRQAGVWLGVALGALALVLGARIQPAQAETPEHGGTLIYTIPASDYPSMDGHQEETFATIHGVAPFYSLLIRVDPTDPKADRIQGDLATKWTVSKDGKTYTFPLHTGVTFHDGSPVTAKDVVASLEHFINPPAGVASPRKSYYTEVESVTAPNDHTVVIKLKFATAAFIPALAQPYNFIYEAKLLAQDPNYYKTHEMGSGPFVLKSQQLGANIIGVRYDKYFRKGLPYLDGFEALYTAKENIEIEALRGGRSMINFRGFPPAAEDELKKAMDGHLQVQQSPWNCSLYIIPNTFKKPFDDVRVRQALNLALDRWGGSQYLSKIAIVKTVGTETFPTDKLAPSEQQMESLDGYSKDLKASRAKAKELLKAAGVPEGFKFKLNNRNTDQPYKFVGTWAIDQWRQIGLDVEQVVFPTSQFFAMLNQDPPQFDTTMDFNCQAIVNPTLDIGRFISKDRTDGNHGHYIDRKLDGLFDAQLHEANPAKQKVLMWDFVKYLNNQAYFLTTLWWHRIVLSNTEVQGYNISPSHYLNQQLEVVWLKKS